MATLGRVLLVGLCLSLVALHAGPAVAQTSPTEAEARSVFDAGQVAFNDGRYADALGYFERAHALSGRPALLFNVALCHDRLRDDDAAIEAYERYLLAVPQASNKHEVDDRLAALRGARERRLAAARAAQPTPVGAETHAVTEPLATHPVDRRSAVEVTQPQHVAEAAAVAQDAHGAGLVNDDAPTRPTHRGSAVYETWWFWTIVGVVVVGGAVGVGVAVSGDASPQPGDIGGVLFALGSGR